MRFYVKLIMNASNYVNNYKRTCSFARIVLDTQAFSKHTFVVTAKDTEFLNRLVAVFVVINLNRGLQNVKKQVSKRIK